MPCALMDNGEPKVLPKIAAEKQAAYEARRRSWCEAWHAKPFRALETPGQEFWPIYRKQLNFQEPKEWPVQLYTASLARPAQSAG